MANKILWDASPSATTLMTTELNNLANNAFAVDGAGYDNSSNLNTNADFELFLDDFDAAPTAGGVFELHFFPKLDGTNYADNFDGDADADSIPNSNSYLGSFVVEASDNDQRMWLRGVELPPFAGKFCVKNSCGQDIAAVDTHFLKIYAYCREVQ